MGSLIGRTLILVAGGTVWIDSAVPTAEMRSIHEESMNGEMLDVKESSAEANSRLSTLIEGVETWSNYDSSGFEDEEVNSDSKRF